MWFRSYKPEGFKRENNLSLGNPNVNQLEEEIEERCYRRVLREDSFCVPPGASELAEHLGMPLLRVRAFAEQTVGVEGCRHLGDPDVRELFAPRFASPHAVLVERVGHKLVGLLVAFGGGAADAVEDAAVVGACVAQRLDALEHVVLLEHLLVRPALGAEEVEVGEAAELDGLQEYPNRHPVEVLVLAEVLGDEVARVLVVRVPVVAPRLQATLD